MSTGWNTARREIAVAAVLVVALAIAAYTLEGAALAGAVLLACSAVGLVVLRALISPDEPAPGPELPREVGTTQSFRGFWRTQANLNDATRSLSAWDFGPRPMLTNLLAARLSEHHGISLADDPETARSLLLRTPSRHDLWFWIDPARPTPDDASSQPGIPPQVLAALIARLEQL